MRVIEDGIHTDISIEEYHANRTHISATQIKYARESLRHFKWYMDGKMDSGPKTCFGFGNSFELALLSPTEYLQKVAVVPDSDWLEEVKQAEPDMVKPRSSKIYQARKKEFEIASAGKYQIAETGPESFETIEEMLSSCYQDEIIQSLIKGTEYQLSLFWTDPETGLKLKTRPDICKRKKNVIVNVKTIEDGSPEQFSRDLVKYDYPIQACIEMRGCIATGLMPVVDNYLWLVCEKSKPYNATIYEFDQKDHGACMDALDFTLSKIAKAKEANKWPGYSDRSDNQYGILTANIPLWYRF